MFTADAIAKKMFCRGIALEIFLSNYSITCIQRPLKESNECGLLQQDWWSFNAGSIMLI